MCFHRGHLVEKVLNDDPSYGGKSVSVVKTEGGKFVALAADFLCLPKGETDWTGFFPKAFGQFVPIRRRLVQRVLFTAKAGVDCDDCVPWPVLQPRLVHPGLGEDLRRRFALILWIVLMPSLLRQPRPVLAKTGSDE